jgi:hypothetical protein
MPEPPGGGSTFGGLPRWVLYAGGGVVVVGGYLFYRARRNAQATSQSTSGYTSGAQAGAYGSALPGAGALQPILINNNPSTGNSPSGPPSPPVWFKYGGGQLQEFQDIGGQLVHRWTDVTGNFKSETLGQGITGNVQVVQGSFNNPMRIDVFAPSAGGQELHAFYWPGIKGRGPSGWSSELLPSAGGAGTGTSVNPTGGATTVGAGIPNYPPASQALTQQQISNLVTAGKTT